MTALIDTKGRMISRPQLLQSMGFSMLASCFGSGFLAVAYGMPLAMFMQSIGASGLVIGLVSTVRQAATVAQIPAALMSENLNSRKSIWLACALTHRALWLVVAAVAAWAAPHQWWLALSIVALVGLSDALGNAAAAPWYSWLADLIPLNISGRFWGMRQTVVTAVSLSALAAASVTLDAFRVPATGQATRQGFGIVFAIAALFGIADIFVHLMVRDPQSVRVPRETATHKRILAPLWNPDFRLLTLALGVWAIAWAMVNAFAPIYLKRDFGLSYTQIASLGIASGLGAVITSYLAGHLVDKVGAKRLAVVLAAATPVPNVVWFFLDRSVVHVGVFAFPQPVVLLVAASLASGMCTSSMYLCQVRLAAELSEVRGRTLSIAVHWSSVGLLSAIGPITGGLLMDHFPAHPAWKIASGLPFSFFQVQIMAHTLLLWGGMLPLLMAIRQKPKESRG